MERPILFSTAMVKAILEGRKTQTRRVIKAPVLRNVREPDKVLFDGKICKFNWHGDDVIGGFEIKPKYQPGDILWVRETWCNYNNKFYYKADKKCYGCTEDGICMPRGIERHVTCELCEGVGVEGYIRWRPSIHMPREAARIFLKVKAIRVEKLQDISETDAIAEGVNHQWEINHNGEKTLKKVCTTVFKEFWDSLNEKNGYGWDTNPWVWVIEFEKQ